ncbi:nuclear transport factor 2 family protein [Segetibacter sp. 3557_3]|uniref:nuclear transport factor 2 family protein n=1 Tax=Segetibacter sp. 3557_3 TaxID=2547429 RepID=UPI00105910A6|nr:nuclear transport factor 2 family protein [Segetibacter sp. 3557_3]TDH28604.1 nuclear transport factor 2 family protein [Segetibacter sp. 3557_3]
MHLSPVHLANHFSKHEFQLVYPHLSEHVQWTLVGEKLLTGKRAVIDGCEQSLQYLAGVTTTFTRFKVIAEGNDVVIDSIAEYLDKNNQVSTIASCDIYHFEEGRLTEITSYCFELNK